MTEEDLSKILDACKPVVCIMVGNSGPSSPQENANRAWSALGAKMGFDYNTVRPIDGKPMRFFSAVPSETEQQREERERKETEAKRLAEIESLEQDILTKQERLETLRA
jgi:hypothetical protein